MFFGKKAEGLLEQVLQKIQGLEEQLSGKADAADSALSALAQTVSRHDMAVEDVLDSLEEIREEREKELSALQGELKEVQQARQEERSGQTGQLLNLILLFHEQQRDMQNQLAGNEAWERQFALAAQKQKKSELLAGVTITGQAGEPIDYDLHDVLEVVETADSKLDRCVAEVFTSGYVYRNIVRKARVSAYKYRELQ